MLANSRYRLTLGLITIHEHIGILAHIPSPNILYESVIVGEAGDDDICDR
jgi:hypothetical protein